MRKPTDSQECMKECIENSHENSYHAERSRSSEIFTIFLSDCLVASMLSMSVLADSALLAVASWSAIFVGSGVVDQRRMSWALRA